MKKIFCKPFYGMCWLVCLWGIHVPTLVVAKQANKKANVTFPSSVTQRARASTVSIDASTLVESYELPSQENGNGVVVDRDHGLILTTSFLTGRGVVAAYNVTFYNGEQAEAKLVYYDPLGYCAFLKVDPTAIPKTVTAVKLREEPPVLHQPIFVWSGENKKNSCKQTMHVGRVADLHYVSQPISQASIVLSMDTIGPTIQGSAIWNKQGEVIGISYAVAETKSFCLDAAYVHYALSFLRKGETPVRRHIGALLDMYSLADAMQYDQFPEAQQKMYAEQFPLALNKVLKVNTILQGTPASQCLLAGDIIWKVDGTLVGPSLVDFEHHMNTTKKSDLQLTIFRRGAFCDITLPLYDLEKHKIKRMVQFGGATFFEIDDVCSRYGGEPAGTLTLCAATSNTIFSPMIHLNTPSAQFFCIKLVRFDGQAMRTLDDLIELIPRLVAKGHFTVEYINHLSCPSLNCYLVGYDPYKVNIAYDSNVSEPMLFTFDPTALSWTRSPILKAP